MNGLLYSAAQEHIDTDYTALAQFESILQADDPNQLGCVLKKITTHLGFQSYLYGAHIRLPNGEIFQYIYSGYPEQWVRTYLRSDYLAIDPIVEHCLKSNKSYPLVWSQDLFDTQVRKDFMEDARAHGIASGLSVPVRGMSGEAALFSVANSIDTNDGRTHSAHHAGMLFVVSAYLHEALRKLVYSKVICDTTPPSLSKKESECLHWWGAGKSAEDIGIIIGISPRTVRFHLDNVKRKLGVGSKAQLIAKAYQLGLLNP